MYDKHTIKPLDDMPASLTFYRDQQLTIPATLPADYKPNMELGMFYLDGGRSYPAVTINGTTTLSLSNFHAEYEGRYYQGNGSMGDDKDKYYGCLISNAPIRSDKVSLTFNLNTKAYGSSFRCLSTPVCRR